MHTCLMHYKEVLSAPCARAEFKIQALTGDDFFLSSESNTVCGGAIQGVCADVTPGGGRIWRCLEKNLNHREVTGACQKIVKSHVELVNTAFYLNPSLADNCEKTAQTLCPTEMNLAVERNFESRGKVISCLIKSRKEITDVLCRNDVRVKEIQRMSALRNDPIAFEDCKADALFFCEDELKGKDGRVRSCLQKNFPMLAPDCQKVQQDALALQAEDIAFNPALRANCEEDRLYHCPSADSKHAIGCLLDKLHFRDLRSTCHEALVSETITRAQSFKFNPNLVRHCTADLKSLVAAGKCVQNAPTDGLTCLVGKYSEITSQLCKSAVLRVQKRESATSVQCPTWKKYVRKTSRSFVQMFLLVQERNTAVCDSSVKNLALVARIW